MTPLRTIYIDYLHFRALDLSICASVASLTIHVFTLDDNVYCDRPMTRENPDFARLLDAFNAYLNDSLDNADDLYVSVNDFLMNNDCDDRCITLHVLIVDLINLYLNPNSDS